MVNILYRHEIPQRLELHNKRILHMARRPYDILTAVAQRTYSQMSLRRTDCSRTLNVQPEVPT